MPQVQLENDPGTPKKSVLHVENLRVLFKGQSSMWKKAPEIRAVDNVSFELLRSEVFSIVGESGSGKTTIARCIMGLNKPTSGRISVGSNDVAGLSGKSLLEYRRKVQMIFQDPFASLNPREDVLTAVSSPIRSLKGERNYSRLFDSTVRLLTEVGLDPSKVLHKLPHQLSGGERQRVNVARALGPDPEILIADEPVTMVDASQRLTIIHLIQELKIKRRLTVLLITHDLATAKTMGGSIAIMYLGKFVETGLVEEVLSRPNHPYTELILQAAPRRNPVGTSLYDESDLSDQLTPQAGCSFQPRCKYSTRICEELSPELLEKSRSHSSACHNPRNLL